MEVESTTQDNITIVRVSGLLDTRASVDFEKKIVQLIQGGAKAFALDFTKLDMITSSGIRVLMMAAKRIGGTDRITLWGLNDQVKVVFTIAGLAGLFQIYPTQQEAVQEATNALAGKAAAAAEMSKMARLAMRLLGDSGSSPCAGARRVRRSDVADGRARFAAARAA
jgi:anti-sigma B factor antagonist